MGIYLFWCADVLCAKFKTAQTCTYMTYMTYTHTYIHTYITCIHVVDPEGAPACPRRYQVRQARGAHPAGTACPSCLSCSLLRRRLASSLIKLAIHLMWCRSKHSAILAYIRAIAILFFSLASTPTGALTSLSCTNCKVSNK